MEPLISVIVPVYNVEKYLDRCITSIVEQTYKNLEIILVDDGSPDNSGAICDQWAKKDLRIKVIHKENGGPSETRNLGVSISNGEYISFIDSDDFVSKDYILILYKILLESGADISCCDYKITTNSAQEFFDKQSSSISTITGKQACLDMFELDKEVFYCVLWGKLYKTEIIKLFTLPVGRVHEDEATTFKYLYSSHKICITNQILYAYYQNKSSIMHIRSSNRRPDALWAKMQRVYFFEEKKEKELLSKALEQIVEFYISRAIMDNKRLPKEAFSFSKNYWSKGINTHAQLKLIFYAISPSLYQFHFTKDKKLYLKSRIYNILHSIGFIKS